jgi:hypothetical protein
MGAPTPPPRPANDSDEPDKDPDKDPDKEPGKAPDKDPGDPPDEPDLPPTVPDDLRADGDACRSNDQCESGHCKNRICCESGECCSETSDCPSDESGEGTECTKPEECQGRRGPVECRKNRCVVTNGINDDSACGPDLVAAQCGLYANAACTGEANQEAPSCANACENDEQCDAAAHCDAGKCVRDRDDGDACETNAQCESNSCSRGACCPDGDCCETVTDCPASYTKAATCDEPESCQGTRGEARCVQGRCEMDEIPDDSGCGWWTPSKLCGQTRRLMCMGGTAQQAPSCGDGTCYVDTQCDNNQHCDAMMRKCVDDVPDGEACDRDALCASNHCNNGLCCESGECCRPGMACANSVSCVSPKECQGERYVNECAASFKCEPVETTEDDSVCWGQLIDACGTFADMRCGAEREQDASGRECPRYCVSSFQCDPGLTCGGAFCYLEIPDNGGGGGGGN